MNSLNLSGDALHPESRFCTGVSEKLIRHVRRQLKAINDLRRSETKPESLQKLTNHRIWLHFWEFATLTGAEFGWSIQQCCNFTVYDIYELKDALEKRVSAGATVLEQPQFPIWLHEQDENKFFHEARYPFWEIKTVFEVSPEALQMYLNNTLDRMELETVSILALENQAAEMYLVKGMRNDG